MTISVIQQNHAGTTASVSSVATTFGSPTTMGNQIVAIVDSRNSTVTSVTDDASGGSNTYVQAGPYYGPLSNPNNNTFSVWYASNAKAATTITAHFGVSDSYYWNSVYEVSPSVPFITYSTGVAGAVNPITTGVLSLGGVQAIILAGMVDIATPITAGTGYTLVNFGVTGDGTLYNATEYHVVSSSEAATATGGGGAWMILAVAFGMPSFNLVTGSLGVTGNADKLGNRIGLGTRALALTGGAVALRQGQSFNLRTGSLALTGNAVSKVNNRGFQLVGGSLTLTPTALTRTQTQPFTLHGGSLALSKNALSEAMRFGLATGAIRLTGNAITVRGTSGKIALATGALGLTGNIIGFVNEPQATTFTLRSGHLGLTGNHDTLFVSQDTPKSYDPSYSWSMPIYGSLVEFIGYDPSTHVMRVFYIKDNITIDVANVPVTIGAAVFLAPDPQAYVLNLVANRVRGPA